MTKALISLSTGLSKANVDPELNIYNLAVIGEISNFYVGSRNPTYYNDFFFGAFKILSIAIWSMIKSLII
jgi:hypothetical protein